MYSFNFIDTIERSAFEFPLKHLSYFITVDLTGNLGQEVVRWTKVFNGGKWQVHKATACTHILDQKVDPISAELCSQLHIFVTQQKLDPPSGC